MPQDIADAVRAAAKLRKQLAPVELHLLRASGCSCCLKQGRTNAPAPCVHAAMSTSS